MLSIFSSKKMPVGLHEEVIELQEAWNTFLLKLEEKYRQLIIAGSHDQLTAVIQEARDAYQLKALPKYNAFYVQHTDNPLAIDLLDHFRDKIYHMLLQWEKRLSFLQEKNLRGNFPDKSYVMVGTNDEGIIYYAYYGAERMENEMTFRSSH
jgi:hypothetical protein